MEEMKEKEGMTRKEFLSSVGKGVLGLSAVGLVGATGALAPDGASAAKPDPDPLPFKLVPAGTLDPAMDKLLGVAIGKGDALYAAGAPGVKVYGPRGQLLRTIATSGPACCVAVDPEGFVYAGQRARIEKFDAEGKRVATWGGKGDEPGQFQFVTALAVNERFVYVADSAARRIQRFAADGDYIDAIGGYTIPSGNPCCAALDEAGATGDEEEKGFVIPSGYFDCALDAKGILYVGHTGAHRVERYDQNGRLLGSWGQFGPALADFCGCCNPTNLALFADGRVATAEKGVPRLKVYDAAGKLLACLDERAFPGNTAGLDLAIDSKGRIALLEPIARQIRFYEMVNHHG